MIDNDFNSIIELTAAFPDQQTCIDYLERRRWNGTVISPFDKTSKVYPCKGNRYRCKNTSKYFNVMTNTLFHGTKVELRKWFVAIWILTSHKKGISSIQLGRDIGVTQGTAWFMLQRIRGCFKANESTVLKGAVEADETYIGGLQKNKHWGKKLKFAQGRSGKGKTAVFGLLERKGKVFAKTVKNTNSFTLLRETIAHVNHGTIYTDEWSGYKYIKRAYSHKIVQHNIGKYVDGDAHTNTIEGFWSLLKRMIRGILHWVSSKHLQRYINEMAFRYNSRGLTEQQRFNNVLENLGERLTYETLIDGRQGIKR